MAIEILPETAPLLDGFIAAAIEADQSEAMRNNPGMLFHLVRWENGVKIEVFSNEHPPPHFRLKHKNLVANFTIADCELLNGDLRVPHRAVRKWWLMYRDEIAKAWNRHRPDGCSVGLIDIKGLNWQ